jgi:hypothetical protein
MREREKEKKNGLLATNQIKPLIHTHTTSHGREHNVAFNYTIKRYFLMLEGVTRVI